jgi:hypothetical protein
VSKTWRFLKKHGALERSDQNIARFTRDATRHSFLPRFRRAKEKGRPASD